MRFFHYIVLSLLDVVTLEFHRPILLDIFKIHTCCVKKDIMHYFLVACFREVGVFITGSFCSPSYPCCICLLSAKLTNMYTVLGSYVFLV